MSANGYSYDYLPQNLWQPGRIGKFHSATIGITYETIVSDPMAEPRLWHQTDTTKKPVRFVSYKDGIRVGCTYISNEAIEFIYKKHKEFLHSKDCVEHQSGVD